MVARVKVVIADDHAVVREGIKMILGREPDIEIVGEASNGREALDLVAKARPAVVVMDISMPEMGGIEATKRVKEAWPKVNVLALTMHEDESYVFQLLKAGASGYVLKRGAAQDLVQAIRSAARGEAFLYPSVARSVLADYLKRVQSGEDERKRYDGLTDREREILALIAEGLSNQEIAQKLYISIKTVQTHRTHIMEKLDLHNRAQLVRYAIRKGLIEA
jgi:two-component system response regulator NreC